jgi:hypothetical protein
MSTEAIEKQQQEISDSILLSLRNGQVVQRTSTSLLVARENNLKVKKIILEDGLQYITLRRRNS